jgi:hypothetical protein
MATRKKKRPDSVWGGARKGAGRKGYFRDSADRTIRFERENLEALDALAEGKGVTGADLIREALSQYLRRHGNK